MPARIDLPRAADVGAGLVTRSTHLTITSCDFIGNNASQYGGAVTHIDGGSLSVRNTLFYNNSAGVGGGSIGIAFSSPEDR